MTPTRDEIEAGRSPNGGWTREQLAEWGIPWPPPKGWRRRLENESEVRRAPHLVERLENLIAALDEARDVDTDDQSRAEHIDTAAGIAGEILTMIDGR